MAERTINDMFQESVRKYGDKDALQVKKGGKYIGISYSELGRSIENFSLGLISLGIEKGDKIAILSENRPEWVISDLGILSAGGINVPIFSTLPPGQIEYILNDSGAEMIILSTERQLDKVLKVRDNIETLRNIIVMDDFSEELGDSMVMKFSEVLKRGEELGKKSPELYQRRAETVKEDDLASILYTSGTTGDPKGAMLTHWNFRSNCEAALEVIDITQDDIMLSFIPLSHVFERTGGYYAPLRVGATIAYAENLLAIANNILEVRPTLMVAVPRLYERMFNRIIRMVESGSPIKKKIFYWGVKVGRIVGEKKLHDEEIPSFLNMKFKIADKLVFSKLREKTGGRLNFFVSGGAPLAKEIAEFFYAAGITILEGYGLTESSPVISANTFEHLKFGTVGQPVPGVDVKIAEDGEILARGPNIMKGYYNKEEETKEAIDEEGWLYTGDIGHLDEEGFLTITDRKKNIIVLSNGKNVSPQPIENKLKTTKYIGEAMLIGDKMKYITALIVPDFDNLKDYAKEKDISFSKEKDLVEDKKIISLIRSEIDKVNEELAGFERIRKFMLMSEEFSQEKEEVTPTLKLKRGVIMNKHKDTVGSMYS